MTPARRGGKRVGYIRVSSVDQNTERQLEGVLVDKRFTDKASGKDTKRPQLQTAMEYLRDGDVLVVHSMDRIARNLDDLRKVVSDFTARGVMVEFVKEISPSQARTAPCPSYCSALWAPSQSSSGAC
jgi:DNA invertase Pin-like site-specific DNA recombinase